MSINFGDTERHIKHLFAKDDTFEINNKIYKIILSGKPTCSNGEPKTDIYVLIEDISSSKQYELKISIKKPNADFLENKISAERAESILGEDWREIIQRSTLQLENAFKNRTLIYKNKQGRTNAGSITLGWKFELVNKCNGELSNRILLNHQQIVDVYSGNTLPLSKKNSFVNGIQIPNSGVANLILIGNIEDFNDINSILANLITIDAYAKANPNIYFACKALNYRTFESKFDGNRPLSVFVDWNAVNGKLEPTIKFDSPLTVKGNEVANKLLATLSKLNIRTTDDITEQHIDLHQYAY